MVFDNVFPSGLVIQSLEKRCGHRIAAIPFADCAPNTSYLISEDGKHVFVNVDFGGYCQTKEIQIIPAGKRSKNSMPAFKRRNNKNAQCYATIPSAVYGAFVLGDEVPRFKLKLLDGNPNNCAVNNLAVADDTPLKRNLQLFSYLYAHRYNSFCRYLSGILRISLENAQDYASDAFIEMCRGSQPINPDRAEQLWYFLAYRRFISRRSRDRIIYAVYDTLLNLIDEANADDSAIYHNALWRLPDDCRKLSLLILAGYRQDEIASQLGCSQAWVSKLLCKTKKLITQHDK